jgi:FkbM family methyltransferase
MPSAVSLKQESSHQPRRAFASRLQSVLATPLQFGALYFRPLWLLKAIKHLKPQFIGKKFRTIFDPNGLRKKFNVRFKQKLVLVEAYGGTFQIDINDHLGYQFLMKDGFDNFLLWLGTKLGINNGDVLLDIGANVGSVCVPFALRFGTEIIAIEASKTNCAILLKNAALNGLKLQVHCNCAVDLQTAQQHRYLEFFSNNGNMAASSMFNRWNPSVSAAQIEYARTAVADQLIGADARSDRIKLIKLDVEGAEAIVLRGMSELLATNAPIVFEYRIDVMLRDLKDDGTEMINLLRANHTIFGIEVRKGDYALVEFDPKMSYENALAVPNGRLDELTRILRS